ncbi:MAG: hypothetical protein A2W99_00405 [Bacteroidetes bacterium GWF2_33_16]|nr:MAG: hypothetical protein A2X00_03110 [Bacteroidetes bacterium GWE2_32_14]OFY08734.1 MAG: hypothetical protein A2W99_00405 [Bacteroidetes bacterium GWF2_33_16]
MKKFLVLLSSVAFITVMSLSVANAQEPEKKCDEKAKTEACCSKEKSKDCSKACDKKAPEAKKTDVKKEEKKEEKK